MTIDFLRENNLIIFEALSGSHAYGTNIATSDKDYRGIFCLPHDYILGDKYVEQVNDEKNDIVFYEVKRFLELLKINNPNILELLYCPNDCIVYKHPVFDFILKEKEKFITKICRNSIAGYAKAQISKSRGLDKKQNWEKERVERKTPIDFCYAIEGERTIPLKIWLENNNMEQKFCGISAVPHARDLYALFYDWSADGIFSERMPGWYRKSSKFIAKTKSQLFDTPMGYGFKGVAFEDSNQIRLSSIPKGVDSIINVFFNKDGYSMHCKDFREYEDWLKKRNINRWTDFEKSGQQLDGKNLLHCVRLVEMAREISEGKGVNVRRPNADYLLQIRRGEVPLKELIDWAENEIKVIDELFLNSNLPDNVDSEFCHQLLVKIRKEFYGIK